MTTTQLHKLHPGQTAYIVQIEGQRALRRRLVEMGIVKGETVVVERIAPLGDPVAYRIKGYCLSLRRAEAAQIRVAFEELKMADLTFALAGNPNAGKSTIFNAFTGLRQHVGNWPGKTVEKRIGACRSEDLTLDVVDLPGTYSLTAYSPEELIARDYIVREPPDVVIVVVDVTNLERNLYLTVQILELGVPVVVALNMMDALHANGGTIDLAALSKALGNTPVVPTAANRGEGMDVLMKTAVRVAQTAHRVEA